MPATAACEFMSATSSTGKSEDVRFRAQFKKTILCAFFERGRCTKGSQCEFAHGQGDLQALPDLTKTSLCRDWQSRRCDLPGQECPFAHGVRELRVSSAYVAPGAGAPGGLSRGRGNRGLRRVATLPPEGAAAEEEGEVAAGQRAWSKPVLKLEHLLSGPGPATGAADSPSCCPAPEPLFGRWPIGAWMAPAVPMQLQHPMQLHLQQPHPTQPVQLQGPGALLQPQAAAALPRHGVPQLAQPQLAQPQLLPQQLGAVEDHRLAVGVGAAGSPLAAAKGLGPPPGAVEDASSPGAGGTNQRCWEILGLLVEQAMARKALDGEAGVRM